MSQQYDYPPPPPPPSGSRSNAPAVTSLPRRQRIGPAQPPTIATNLARTLGVPSQTPISATSLGSGTSFSVTPVSPSVYSSWTSSGTLAPPPSAISPMTTVMEPYDPRQWSNRGQVSGTQRLFQHRASAGSAGTRETSGMEAAMPSPPPPYSPESAARRETQQPRPVSMFESSAYTASPAQNSTTSSPQVPMSPSFPPPPGFKRSSSGQRNFFSLSNLRKATTNTEVHVPQNVPGPDNGETQPPGAKRAASTGQLNALQNGEGPSVPRLGPPRKASPASWKPGMPLPGPPPGPPPPGTRTQSLNRYDSSSRSNSIGSDGSIEVPQHRRSTVVAPTLGPIPPTPAGWVDPDAPAQPSIQPLRIDTGSGHDSSLTRRPAKRDSSGQGIRERRSRSRAAKESAAVLSPDNETSTPDDLVLSPSDGSIRRRRDHTRAMSGDVANVAGVDSEARAGAQALPQTVPSNVNSVLTPPYTPAVGKSNEEPLKRLVLRAPGSASSDRSISQAMYQPVEDGIGAPLDPGRPPSSSSAKTSARLDPFYLQALDRHRAFLEKEAAATSDEDRLQLFANFMVNESRLRRDRYAGAYSAMAGDIVDLTRDMWRPYSQQHKRSITPTTSMSSFDPMLSSWASDGQPGTTYGNQPSSASSYGEFTPRSDAVGLVETDETMERSDSRQRGDTFKPSLSPIPSMNVSSAADEESSRGRAPSRWWENKSNSGSNSIGKADRIEKTHRETKYMGVNIAALQDSEQVSPRTSWHTGSTPGPSVDNFGLGPNEYPPEKVGWHEPADMETPIATPGRQRKSSTPAVDSLDVSRLVTLPPPYPRHYPAVKNKHPLLADLRNDYRSLADHTKIKEIRDGYVSQCGAIQSQQEEAAQEKRKQLRSGIQERIADGTMSYAEAAQAEGDFEHEEAERSKAIARSRFDMFEAIVAHPLNALLTEKLEKANACIDQLRVELQSRNEASDPNQAQEEGDEQPERLEKLTLLKWLFESREQLHKEMYELHTDRSAKYAEVILTPFRLAKQQDKLDGANAFFTKDTRDRQLAFAKDSSQRFEELQEVIDSNVTLGVEDQLSAFWDIAPGLLEVIQQVPADFHELEILIPDQEYAENPAYNEHPLQYLYSLLSHAQKSAYQFIESQTNLLCLLHEVRTATTKSSLRLLDLQERSQNSSDETRKSEMKKAKREQEERLTEDLKEKVGEVERQWREALGERLEECKGRVKAFLEQSGGWEEGLEG